MKTLIISKQDISKLITMPELIEGIRLAYITYTQDKTIKPQRTSSQICDTSIVVNHPGYLSGFSMFTVKVNVKVPTNPVVGLPFLNGSISLFDQSTGQLLSIMDSSLITAMRTGAAGAIGVECLANSNTSVVALIGAGMQAEWQIRALHSISRVSHVNIYDIIDSQAKKLSEKLINELRIPAYVNASAKEAISSSDIAILTTQSKKPIVTADMLHPGLHLNAFGADQPGKVELDADILTKSRVILDDKDLALSDGTLNVAYKLKQFNSNLRFHEIGDVLINQSLGRASEKEVTIFGNVGLAFQDLVACSIIYKNALKLGIGLWIDLDSSIESFSAVTK